MPRMQILTPAEFNAFERPPAFSNVERQRFFDLSPRFENLLSSFRRRQLVQRQQGICPICHQHLENGEELHIHHVVPKKSGGKEDLANLWLVHYNCHRQLHSSSAPLGVRRLLEPRTR